MEEHVLHVGGIGLCETSWGGGSVANKPHCSALFQTTHAGPMGILKGFSQELSRGPLRSRGQVYVMWM